MKKTLKTILQNSIDEKKYIFKYPITTFKYYDNANFLFVDNRNENNDDNDNKIEETKNIEKYNVEKDIEKYLEDYNNEKDEKSGIKYTKKIYILGGLAQDRKSVV